jgi:hypothetical protein
MGAVITMQRVLNQASHRRLLTGLGSRNGGRAVSDELNQANSGKKIKL